MLSLDTYQSTKINAPRSLPQLDCASVKRDSDRIASIDLDNNVNIFSKSKSGFVSSFQIEQAKGLFQLANTDSVLIASDRNRFLYLFDDKTNKVSASYKTDKQMTQMKVIDNKSLVCPDKETITFYDIRQMAKPYLAIANMMKTEIASIGCIPKEAMLYGSIEGKIAVEYFDTSKSLNYSFKCHRIETDTKIKVYSVNAIEYDSTNDLFYSGGSDGFVYCWNNKKRKKLFKCEQYSEPISHLAIKASKGILAIGLSWLNEDGNFSLNEDKHTYKINIMSLDEIKTK